jgi:Icc protein
MQPLLIWGTDLHFDHATENAVDYFFNQVREANVPQLLIAGDIASSATLKNYLDKLDNELNMPIYFVLGNHDFYGGSLKGVREFMRSYASAHTNLHYLTDDGSVKLYPETYLIGDDGWADGQAGDYGRSKIMLNDYLFIEELKDLSHEERGQLLQKLGLEATERVRAKLLAALEKGSHVILLTHVPPFPEGALYRNRPSDSDWTPHFVCHQMGQMLLKVMGDHLEKRLTILSGHSHHPAHYRPYENITCYTAHADYGHPKMSVISL